MPLDQLLLPMALCADAEVKDGALVGDPTEGALVVLAAKGGVDPALTREQYPRVATLPFDAAYKFMATFHRMEDDAGKEVIRAFVKGAPDQLLARASAAPRPRRQHAPDRRGPRAVPGRERTTRRTGPAGHGHGAARLRSGDVRSERRPAAAGHGPRAARPGGHRRPAAGRGPRRHRQGQGGRHQGPDDHRRPRRHGRGDRDRSSASRAGPSPARSSRRCPTRRPIGKIDEIGVIARVAPEDKVRLVDDPAAQGPHRGHDRRRRERRAGPQDGRHRRGDGHHRHRGLQGGRGDDPDRRQLRDHRQGRGAGPRALRQPACATSGSRWRASSGSSARSSGRASSTSWAASRSCRCRRCGSTSPSTSSRRSALATASLARA